MERWMERWQDAVRGSERVDDAGWFRVVQDGAGWS